MIEYFVLFEIFKLRNVENMLDWCLKQIMIKSFGYEAISFSIRWNEYWMIIIM